MKCENCKNDVAWIIENDVKIFICLDCDPYKPAKILGANQFGNKGIANYKIKFGDV